MAETAQCDAVDVAADARAPSRIAHDLGWLRGKVALCFGSHEDLPSTPEGRPLLSVMSEAAEALRSASNSRAEAMREAVVGYLRDAAEARYRLSETAAGIEKDTQIAAHNALYAAFNFVVPLPPTPASKDETA